MRAFGALLIVAGLVWAVVAFDMPTTVEAGGERIGTGSFSVDIPRVTVNNFGLMERRRNHLMMAGVTIIAGIILFGFGSISSPRESATPEDQRVCPYCAETVRAVAKVCRYCNRELPSQETEAAEARLAEERQVQQDDSDEITAADRRLVSWAFAFFALMFLLILVFTAR